MMIRVYFLCFKSSLNFRVYPFRHFSNLLQKNLDSNQDYRSNSLSNYHCLFKLKLGEHLEEVIYIIFDGLEPPTLFLTGICST